MSNIQVVIRCRGRSQREISAKSPIVVDLPNDTFSSTEPYVTVNTSYGSKSINNSENTSNSQGSGSNAPSRRSSGGNPANMASFNNYKTYKVDQVYGSQADQSLIFQQVALPLFKDFINGFNVTILAYGQTGTGKTFTMCGDYKNETSKSRKVPVPSENAGIIPRVLMELFRSLDDDYVVKCSFLELYNEELKDLLEDDGKPSRLRIYENTATQKKQGKNGPKILIQNLNEEYISSCEDGLAALNRGLNRRKTASTKLNDNSSRSHTIFTVNLYRKVKTKTKPDQDLSTSDENAVKMVTKSGPDHSGITTTSFHRRSPTSTFHSGDTPPVSPGEELFRVSKMNLVDLAGSENINRSGAINQRAKEAGSINQSLLTLGRVISSLSENTSDSAQHIPYRESKLTRLLQDSLGGSTKTTLIANISPAKINLDETVSTLDYASKAKSIKNVPQIGQESDLIMKKVLVKNLTQDIVRLNHDLIATRNKNGIYLSEDSFNLLNDENEAMKSSYKEQKLQNETLQTTVAQLRSEGIDKDVKIQELQAALQEKSLECEKITTKNSQQNQQINEQKTQLHSLSSQISSMKEKHTSTTAKITRIIFDNLSKSVLSIQEIVEKYDNKNSCEQISDASAKLAKNMSQFRAEIASKVDEIDANLNGTFLTELPQYLARYNEKYTELAKLASQFSSGVAENMQNLKNSNEKLDNYLQNEHLQEHKQKRNVDQLVQARISSDFEQLNTQFSSKIADLVQQSQSQVQTLFENCADQIAKTIVSSERSELVKAQKEWAHNSAEAFARITDGIKNCNEFDYSNGEKETAKKLGELNSQNGALLNALREVISKEKGAYSISHKLENQLTSVARAIQSNDANIDTVLKDVKQHLNRISQFEKLIESPQKRSPQRVTLKSPSRSDSNIPSPSKVRARSVSPQKSLLGTKIPQLVRDDNKENEPVVKRRRVEM